jgi:hypothetical protein
MVAGGFGMISPSLPHEDGHQYVTGVSALRLDDPAQAVVRLVRRRPGGVGWTARIRVGGGMRHRTDAANAVWTRLAGASR